MIALIIALSGIVWVLTMFQWTSPKNYSPAKMYGVTFVSAVIGIWAIEIVIAAVR